MGEKWRHRLSWLLLAAYLPLVVASVLHVHHGRQAAVLCDDCLHHVDHPAHYGAAADDAQVCLVCHLLSMPRLAGAAIVAMVAVMAVAVVRAVTAGSLAGAASLRLSPRAPPTVC
ncbi:MAG: hypothetical protein IJ760_08855 [Bacteroidales bacterium]|nr:hypothetical protein [Bacteroidales bacterium]MBR1785527.1 hypothetical protein [Bacteroidales bacterium]